MGFDFCLFVCFFIYLFWGVLGLRFCARAFSSCGEWGPLFIAARGPLTVVASLVAEHRLQTRRLSSCGSRAQLLRGTWDLPRPGLKPVSLALAGRFSTTAPPGKPLFLFLMFSIRPTLLTRNSPISISPFWFNFALLCLFVYIVSSLKSLGFIIIYSLKYWPISGNSFTSYNTS